jgi:hypothetical protein
LLLVSDIAACDNPRHMRVVVISASLLALGLVWWLAVREPERPADVTTAPESEAGPALVAVAGGASPARVPEPVPEAEPKPLAEPAVAPAELPRTAPPAATATPPQKEGPVEELAERFAHEPRDSDAASVEANVQAVFLALHMRPDMLKSVLCRESLCRLELRWRPERSLDYMTVMTRLTLELAAPFAIRPAEQADPDGALPLEVYWPRKSAKPAP